MNLKKHSIFTVIVSFLFIFSVKMDIIPDYFTMAYFDGRIYTAYLYLFCIQASVFCLIVDGSKILYNYFKNLFFIRQ